MGKPRNRSRVHDDGQLERGYDPEGGEGDLDRADDCRTGVIVASASMRKTSTIKAV